MKKTAYAPDPHNTLLVIGPITYENLGTIITGIVELDKRKLKNGFRIRLISPGGETAPALAIYDTLKLCKNKVTIEAFGECSSAAALIMQAADLRWLSENAVMLIHDSFASMNPGNMSSSDLIKEGSELNRLNTLFHEIIAKHSDCSVAEIQKLCSEEKHLTAEEALYYGLVDWIIA